MVKESTCNAGDMGSIPGSGRSPGGGNGNPFQYSFLEKSMDRAVCWATVHEVVKSWTSLKQLSMHVHRLSLMFSRLDVLNVFSAYEAFDFRRVYFY